MATVTGTIDALDGEVVLEYQNQPTVVVKISGVYAAGVTLAFDYSHAEEDWTGVLGATPGAPILVAEYAPLAGETRFFQFCGVQAGLFFRVRATTFGTGAVTVTISAAESFLPDELAGMTLWLRGDVDVFADASLTTPAVNADPVRGWQDGSPEENNFLEANALRVPEFAANAQNGLGVVRFLDGFLTSAPQLTSDIITASACTMFVVMRVAAIHTAHANPWGNDTVFGNNSGYIGLTLKQPDQLLFYNWDGTADVVASTVAVAGGFAAFMARHESGSLYISKNAGIETSGASGNTTLLTDPMYVGNGSAVAVPFDGDLGELIVYNRALTAPEIAQVYNYLNDKWSLY